MLKEKKCTPEKHGNGFHVEVKIQTTLEAWQWVPCGGKNPTDIKIDNSSKTDIKIAYSKAPRDVLNLSLWHHEMPQTP